MKKQIVFILVFCILFSGTVLAEQQSQQTNHLFLDPFYRPSMNGNTNYTYTLNFNPPDKVGDVSSAIINYQMWLNPTIEFFLWVDGKPCNNPSYIVHTTYAGAGEGNIFFECSNIITEAGTYEVTLMPDDDTGAITSWADLTYTNEPKAKITFGGTDYFSTEPTQLLFVQLIDNLESGIPIDDALCFAEVYGSDATSHLIEGSPMVHTEHGIYHLHTAIEEVGVHIVSVECYYDYNSSINNVTSTDTTFGNYERVSAFTDYEMYWTDDGGSEMNNMTGDVSAIGSDLTVRHDWTNKYAIINTTGTFENGDVVRMYARNINNLNNNIYLHDVTGSIIYGSYLIDTVSVFEWNNITLSNAGSGITEIYISDLAQGGAHDIRWDYVEILSQTGGGWFGDPDTNNSLTDLHLEDDVYWQIVEDENDTLDATFNFSGISGLYNETANLFWNGKWSGTEDLEFLVYNFTSLDWDLLDNAITTSVSSIDVNNQINVEDYISSGILLVRINHTLNDTDYGFLEIDRFTLEIYVSGGAFVNDVKGGGEVHIINSTIFGDDVWSAPSRTLTDFNFDTTDEEGIWDYENRTLTASQELWTGQTEYDIGETDGFVIVRLVGATGDPVTGASCNASIGYPNHTRYLDNQAMTEIITGVAPFNATNEGGYYLDFPVPQTVGVYPYAVDCQKLGKQYFFLNTFHVRDINEEIWNATNRSLTEFNFDVVNESEISDTVWNATNRSLTEFNFDVVNETAVAEAVWSWNGTIVANILSQFASAFWNWVGSVSTSITDFFRIEIWNAPSRNLTYTEDVTNYTQIQEIVIQYGNNNTDLTNYTLMENLIIAYGNLNSTTDETNYTLIQDLITAYGNQDSSNYTLIEQLIIAYGNLNSTTDETNYTLIQELVTLYGNNNSDLTNYTLMQELIIAFGNLNVTTDETNYTAIQNLITQYGNNDVSNYTLIEQLIIAYGNLNSTTDETNYTLIQNLINQYGNDDNTNYTLIENLIAQYEINYTLMEDLIVAFGNLNSTTDETNYTLIQELISQYSNQDTTNYTLMEQLIIAYANLNVTTDETNYTQIQDLIIQYANNNTDLTNYTIMQELIIAYGNLNVTTDETNYSLIEELIIAYGNLNETTNYTLMQELITQYGNNNTDLTNYTLMEQLIIAYGNLNVSEDMANYTLIQDLITNYGNVDNANYTLIEDLITLYGNNLSASDIWAYTNRSLTEFNFIVSTNINMSEIAQNVWAYSDRNLTYFPAGNQISPQDIWEYSNRSLSEFHFVVDTTIDLSDIPTQVWNYTNRSLTLYLTDALTAEEVWNFTTRNLTYFPTAPLPNNLTAAEIWTYVNRNLTYYENNQNLTALEIWEYVNRSLTTNSTIINIVNVAGGTTTTGGGGTTYVAPGECYYISSDLVCTPKYSIYECRTTDYDTIAECLDELNTLNQQPEVIRNINLNAAFVGGLFFPSKPWLGLLILFFIIVLLYELIVSDKNNKFYKRIKIKKKK